MARRKSPSAQRAAPPTQDLPLNTDIPISHGIARLLASPDNPRHITLSLDGTHSSFIDLEDPAFLAFEYMQEMAAVIDAANQQNWQALHIGAAGCSMARWLDATYPGSHQLGLEIDELLSQYVRQWFDLPRSPALKLRAIDGYEYLEQCPPGRWDLIIRDVFQRATIPEHLKTDLYIGQVLRVLKSGGLYLANGIGRNGLTEAKREIATLAHQGVDWADIGLIAEPQVLRGRRYGNVVIAYRSNGHDFLTSPALGRTLRSLAVPAHLLTGDDLIELTEGSAPYLAQ